MNQHGPTEAPHQRLIILGSGFAAFRLLKRISPGSSPSLVKVVAVFTQELTNQVAGLGGAALPQSGGVIASESYQARRDHVRFDLRARSPDGLVFDQHSTIGLHRVGPGHPGNSFRVADAVAKFSQDLTNHVAETSS
jgi:hypothetical protein